MSEKWLNDEDLKELLGEDSDVFLTPERESTASDTTYSKKEIEARSVKFEELNDEGLNGEETDFEVLLDLPLEVRVLLGSVEKTIEELVNMNEGSVVQLDQIAGEPVELVVGEQVIAKGETVIIDDKFGVLITEIIPPKERIKNVESKLRKQKQ